MDPGNVLLLQSDGAVGSPARPRGSGKEREPVVCIADFAGIPLRFGRAPGGVRLPL